MTTTTETIPTTWTAADEHFYLVVRDLFAPAFLEGAGVLLASYDDDTAAADSTQEVCGQPHPAARAQVGTMVAEVSGPS
jgi:hypothetical protein